MCDSVLHVHAQAKTDPTRTTTIRRQFEGEASRRFRNVAGILREAVVGLDVLGLRGTTRTPTANRDQPGLAPGAFDFASTPQKVGAFMRWLDEMQRKQILDVSQGVSVDNAARQAWTSIYVRSAYQRGIAHAGQQMRGAGATVDPRWINAAFNRPFHADRLGIIYTRTYKALEGVTQAMDTQISRVLTQAIAEGVGPEEMARRLTDRVDAIGRTRARVLARTEVINAHAEASLNAYQEAGVEGVSVKAEFATAGDSRVCPECRALEGKVYAIAESRGIIPVHPQCLPGDSLVLARSGIAAASKRWFDGDLAVIRTASGRELACTPNHPILTPGGWIGAGALNVGSHVISDGGREWTVMSHNDSKNVPARIEYVAEAARRSSRMPAAEMPVSAPDFHGDGIDGDIGVVWADRELRLTSQSALLKQRGQFALDIRNKLARIILSSKRAFTQLIMRPLASARSRVCRPNLTVTLLIAHRGPLNTFRFIPSALCDSRFGDHFPDSTSIKRHAVGNRLGGFACSVCGDDLIGERSDELRARHISIAEQPADDAVVDAVLAAQLASGSAGPVFRDEVVSVDTRRFSGHVYNLETGGGYYSAQGIITHNCRCAWLPALDDMRGTELR